MPADKHAAPETIRVRVEADASSGVPYDVVIRAGLMHEVGDLIVATAPSHRYAILSDSNVAPLYGKIVADQLGTAGCAADLLSFPAGESSKSREVWANLTDNLLECGYGRDSCIVAVGGGVTGDLAGFVAATFMRGIAFVNVPTTLLAMLDSAVGGKTGVDTPTGKNLVGAFHQPALVIVDPGVLTTLPEAEYRASLSEAIKHGVIADAEYFAWINENVQAIVNRDPHVVTALVRRSVEIKAAVVAADPREANRRAILNFGHTLGHAIEQVTAFTVTHGEAVAVGLVLEAKLGEITGVTERGTSRRIADLLALFGLPVDLKGLNAGADSILEATRADKKTRGSTVRYALPRRIGAMFDGGDGSWTTTVGDERVRAVADSGRSAISQAGTEF